MLRALPSLVALSLAIAGRVVASAPSIGQSIADATPMAQVNGLPILYSAVSQAAHDKLSRLQSDYETEYARVTLAAARSRASRIEVTVNELVDNQVLDLEAAGKNTSHEALIAAVKPKPVNDADERAFYAAEQADIGQPFDQVASKIKDFLEGQAAAEAQFDYLEGLRKKYGATIQWEPMREDVEAIGQHLGPQNAPVTIVEFSDFQCPFCRRLAPIMRELARRYPTQVRLVFRNMPLASIHHSAERAAKAGACAAAQGKFWEMHDLMFAEQSSLSDDALKEKARRLKMDSRVFDQCLDSDSALKGLEADQRTAMELGLTSTPSSFVNGRFVAGSLPLYRWQEIINDELKRGTRPKLGRLGAAP